MKKLGKTPKAMSPFLGSPEGTQPDQPLEFRTADLQNSEKVNLCCLKLLLVVTPLPTPLREEEVAALNFHQVWGRRTWRQ